MPQDPRWGRTYESYSEDPNLVRDYARAIVEGLQGEADSNEFLDSSRVLATAKHFLGDGATDNGGDQGDAQITETELAQVHAQGYVAALEAGAQTVMASFSSWQGEKMHGHSYLLTSVLKEHMGHDGVVVGDWNGHGQLPGCSNASSPDALNAGLDLFMAVEDWKQLFYNTLRQVKDGIVPLARLEDAVRRMLRVKMRAGLFDAKQPSKRLRSITTAAAVGCKAHRAVARDAVRKSLVLLKNQGALLPINASARVLVTGNASIEIGKQMGGWTLTWQGNDNQRADFPGATTILEGIRSHVESHGGHMAYSADGAFTTKPDVAVVICGEEPYAEFQGDIGSLEFEPGHKCSLALMRTLKDQGIPVITVFLSGRPLWVNPELNASDAFIAAWLPGSEGAGVADILFTANNGEVGHDFSGSLPFRWPASPLPGDNTSPLFDLGYGLTYASGKAGPDLLDEDFGSVQDLYPQEIAVYDKRPLGKCFWKLKVQKPTSCRAPTQRILPV